MQATDLSGGFADPAHDAARAFRAMMEAMARPGTIHDLSGATGPAPLSPAAATVLLTLCDGDTPVHLAGDLDRAEIRRWITFHTGAPLTGPEACAFALGHWPDLAPLEQFPAGTPAYPDRSTTLIVELDQLEPEGAHLTGPGIENQATLNLPEIAVFQANAARRPMGLDFIFTCRARVAALPRSTKVTGKEAG